MVGQEDPVQREVHQDGASWEYTEVITSSSKKTADFLHSGLATPNEKPTALEQRIEYTE